MLIIEYVLIAATALYLLEMLFFRLGLERTRSYGRDASYQPTVSVIIAARNEEKNIAECITSLVLLDYPEEKYEIIVVDDNSTDNTAAIVRDFTRKHPRQVKLVHAHPGVGDLRGKANALLQGIEQSNGEILFFTDADCTVQPAWVKETLSYYTEGVGIVAGFTFLTSEKMFEGIQAIDWFLLFGVAASTAAWNIPLTAVGNNLSVRRSAYNEVGGYRNLPFSVTEDYALVQKIHQKTKLRVRYLLNSETLVQSKPCNSWKELFRQKQRWGVGGLDMVFRGFLLMSIPFALHLLILVGCFLVSFPLLAAAMIVKAFADLYLLWKPIRTFKKQFLLKHFLPFELYFSLYELLIPFIALFSKKVVWKERAFGS